MGKRSIKQQHTELQTAEGLAHITENSVVSDDNILPSPAELQAYLMLSPDFPQYFIEVSKKEQEHRHAIEKENVEIVKEYNRSQFSLQKLGMWFAFTLLILLLGIGGFMIYIGYKISEVVHSSFLLFLQSVYSSPIDGKGAKRTNLATKFLLSRFSFTQSSLLFPPPSFALRASSCRAVQRSRDYLRRFQSAYFPRLECSRACPARCSLRG